VRRALAGLALLCSLCATAFAIDMPLAWDAYPPGYASRLRLERSHDSGRSWQVIGTVPATARGMVDTTALPSTVYQYRLIAEGMQAPAESAPSNIVQGSCCVSLSVTPLVASVGHTLTVGWAGIAAPSWTNFVTFAPQGARDNQYITYQRTDGKASGVMAYPVPPVGVGLYELRLYADDTYTKLATSAPVRVGPVVPTGLPALTGLTVIIKP
jgi:hypothetical protein